jgi:hypothetical protein
LEARASAVIIGEPISARSGDVIDIQAEDWISELSGGIDNPLFHRDFPGSPP